MNILFPVSECVPFAKTGGLADVAGALPNALRALGHDVTVVMPLYRQVKKVVPHLEPTGLVVEAQVGRETIMGKVLKNTMGPEGCPIYFIQQDNYFDRPELYQTREGDYPDNDKRFIFFDQAVLALGRKLSAHWDIVHCHDWHTGLIPVYLKTLYRQDPVYRDCKSLMTIHNLAYQGVFTKNSFELTRLPPALFAPSGVEFWGNLNFLKAGLMAADKINTVSKTYAQEIQRADYGCGLEGVLKFRQKDLSGIINGIDLGAWNPETDRHLPVKFGYSQWEKKALMKAALLEEMHLFPKPHVPVLGLITRLDDQKGLDILASVMEKLMNMQVQLVMLGTGAQKYHDLFWALKGKYPAHIAVNLTFDNAMAHRIYAGSDMFLMPSKFEPCGLGQMISMRYATVPVVRRTGGLADTVINFNGHEGNGFTFEPYQGEALLALIKFAVQFYQDKVAWQRLMRNCMECDFSWSRSAEQYETLYRQMLEGPGTVELPL